MQRTKVLLVILFAGLLIAPYAVSAFDPAAATEAYLADVSAEEIANTNGYVDAGYGIAVVEVCVEIAIAIALLGLGLSRRWRDLAERKLKSKFLQAFIYVPIYLVVTTVVLFPLSWYRDFYTEHQYGLSTQAFGPWLVEFLQSAGFSLIGMSLFVALLYIVLRRSPERWWLWASGLVVAFFAIILLISPLYIQPVFNEYRPMDEGPLKERILAMARANGMAADDVKQVDESRQSNRVSANVSGLFGSSRIALNDNLLNRASADGVAAVMGHEIGHYVLNHQWKMMTGVALIFFACFVLADLVFKALLRRKGEAWGVRAIDDYAGFPLLYAVITVIMFFATPLLFHIVYTQEYEADLFAINATQNPDAWAEVALLSAEYRKLHPPAWEEAWLNHHPSPYVRIYTAMRWKAENLPAE